MIIGPRPKQLRVPSGQQDGAIVAGGSKPSLSKGPAVIPGVIEGRLCLDIDDPIPVVPQTSMTELYYVPYSGGIITLYDTNENTWVYHEIPDSTFVGLTGTDLDGRSIAANTNYDVYISASGTGLALSLVQWELSSLGTQRTTLSNLTPVLLDGVLVLSGDYSQRYIGTIRTTSLTQLEDSEARLFVWNKYNQVLSSVIQRIESGQGWSASNSSGTIQWGAVGAPNSKFQVEFVLGRGQVCYCELDGSYRLNAGGSATTTSTIGLDSTTTPDSDTTNDGRFVLSAQKGFVFNPQLMKHVDDGYHYFQALWSTTGSTVLFEHTLVGKSGMYVEIMK